MNEKGLIYFAMATAAALAIFLFMKGKKAVEKTTDAIAKPIADAIIKFTLPGTVDVKGYVQLPDKNVLPMSSIRFERGGSDFYYGQMLYRVVKRISVTPAVFAAEEVKL